MRRGGHANPVKPAVKYFVLSVFAVVFLIVFALGLKDIVRYITCEKVYVTNENFNCYSVEKAGPKNTKRTVNKCNTKKTYTYRGKDYSVILYNIYEQPSQMEFVNPDNPEETFYVMPPKDVLFTLAFGIIGFGILIGGICVPIIKKRRQKRARALSAGDTQSR